MKEKFFNILFSEYFIISINIVLGLLLWVGYFSTYSLIWKFSEFLVPPIIGLLGYESFQFLTKRRNDKKHRFFYRLANAPSVLGGAVGLLPYFCANRRHFYFLVQTEAVSNRSAKPKQYLSKHKANSAENCF